MANSRSARKRIKIAAIKTDRNKRIKSIVKTTVKRYQETLAKDDLESAQAAYIMAQKTIDKAVTKGVMHKNTAARKKSRLSKKMVTA